MQVDCDKCGKTFEVDLREIDIEDGYKFRYFDCPHCKCRYEVLKYKPEDTGKRR